MNQYDVLNEGWTFNNWWNSADDVRDALKFDEISNNWKYITNFGNFFCYKRKSDGRPACDVYLIRKSGNEYGYKSIGIDKSTKYNAKAAKWLKDALIAYGSTEENPGEFKGYWEWINSGKEEKQENKVNIKSKLQAGSKVLFKPFGKEVVVIYDRPYNNQAFVGHKEGDDKLYKWYYRDIADLISESIENDIEINENTTFTDYLKESGYTFKEYLNETRNACIELGYNDIEKCYYNEIKQAFNENKTIHQIASEICARYDEEYNNSPIEYTNYIEESTEDISDGEDYNTWKTDVFRYIDKRLDVNKIKELSSYIKDFIKQEYDNGEPSWFMCAESIVNYARINYPNALKNRASNAYNITD